MAAIKLYLRGDKIKPTINIETAISTRTALIDTGANMPIRFSDIDTFLLEFPNAEETKYVTYIGGLGGNIEVNSILVRAKSDCMHRSLVNIRFRI